MKILLAMLLAMVAYAPRLEAGIAYTWEAVSPHFRATRARAARGRTTSGAGDRLAPRARRRTTMRAPVRYWVIGCAMTGSTILDGRCGS